MSTVSNLGFLLAVNMFLSNFLICRIGLSSSHLLGTVHPFGAPTALHSCTSGDHGHCVHSVRSLSLPSADTNCQWSPSFLAWWVLSRMFLCEILASVQKQQLEGHRCAYTRICRLLALDACQNSVAAAVHNKPQHIGHFAGAMHSNIPTSSPTINFIFTRLPWPPTCTTWQTRDMVTITIYLYMEQRGYSCSYQYNTNAPITLWCLGLSSLFLYPYGKSLDPEGNLRSTKESGVCAIVPLSFLI